MIGRCRVTEKTLGEKRVRVDFNPSQEGVVYDIKRHTAAIIDLVEKVRENHKGNPEVHRLCSLAQTHYEDAAMWAVKAATS
jgi:hypothetical protein